MLKIELTSQFKKDYKRALARGLSEDAFKKIVLMLAQEQTLPLACKDHKLIDSRKYINVRECHISPDWLLVYFVDHGTLSLRLVRTGTHSDLF